MEIEKGISKSEKILFIHSRIWIYKIINLISTQATNISNITGHKSWLHFFAQQLHIICNKHRPKLSSLKKKKLKSHEKLKLNQNYKKSTEKKNRYQQYPCFLFSHYHLQVTSIKYIFLNIHYSAKKKNG